MNKESDFKFIERISKAKLQGLDYHYEVIETYFKLCYLYVMEYQLEELKFEQSFDGIFKFSNWVYDKLYTENDPLYIINEIYLFNNDKNEFTKLYSKFFKLFFRCSVDKFELYHKLDKEIQLRYKEFIDRYETYSQ